MRSRLRSTKMPGVVDFRDELPYSPTGKLLRRVLRDELSEAAGGTSYVVPRRLVSPPTSRPIRTAAADATVTT